MQIYSKSKKNCFSSISQRILILFVLSDRAWWGLQKSTQNFKILYLCKFIQNQRKCYFSISQRILILFVLSDRAWWGLRNFYTELWNSLIMQIYANLFKINEKCHLSSIQKSQQICTSGGDVYYASRNLLSTCILLNTFYPPLRNLAGLLYKPIFSRTVIFANDGISDIVCC